MKDPLIYRIGVLPVLLLALLAAGCGSSQTEAPASEKAADKTAAEKEKEKEKEKGGLLTKLLGPEMLTVPAGTSLPVRLTATLSTEKNNDGDRFEAILDRNIAVNNKVVAPVGSTVSGTVYHSKQSGKVKGRAELGLTLTSLVVGGKTYKIDTTNYFRQAAGTKKRDATIIGGSAGVGTLVGAIAGGKKGAAIGAAVGGGAGTGAVLATRGKPVVLPAETRIAFRLQTAIQLPER